MQRRHLLSSDTCMAMDRVTIACWVRKRLVLPLPLPSHVQLIQPLTGYLLEMR